MTGLKLSKKLVKNNYRQKADISKDPRITYAHNEVNKFYSSYPTQFQELGGQEYLRIQITFHKRFDLILQVIR